jgi:hypothetical protein
LGQFFGFIIFLRGIFLLVADRRERLMSPPRPASGTPLFHRITGLPSSGCSAALGFGEIFFDYFLFLPLACVFLIFCPFSEFFNSPMAQYIPFFCRFIYRFVSLGFGNGLGFLAPIFNFTFLVKCAKYYGMHLLYSLAELDLISISCTLFIAWRICMCRVCADRWWTPFPGCMNSFYGLESFSLD